MSTAFGERTLQRFWCCQQFHDSAHQAPGLPSVDDPVIKTDRQICLESGNKTFGFFVPERPLFTVSETDDQCLAWKWYGRCPMDSQRSEVGHRSDGGAFGFLRQTLFLGGLEEFFVLSG